MPDRPARAARPAAAPVDAARADRTGADERWRVARRDVIRRLHPDRGGDPEAFRAALAAVDAARPVARPEFPVAVPTAYRRPTRWRRLLRSRAAPRVR